MKGYLRSLALYMKRGSCLSTTQAIYHVANSLLWLDGTIWRGMLMVFLSLHGYHAIEASNTQNTLVPLLEKLMP